MADLKISQLNSIVTVVPATDVLPVVQGGTTLKITPNQILGAGGTATLASATITGAATVGTTLGVTGASTLASVGVTGAATVGTTLLVGTNATLTNGNVILGTSGKGIDFTAAGNEAGMTSELLNDYEEGTWTATLTFSTTPQTSSNTFTGRYTKVGRIVTVQGQILIGIAGFVKGAAAGNFQLTGLPFAAAVASVQYQDLAASIADISTGSFCYAYIPIAGTTFSFESVSVVGTRVQRDGASITETRFAATNAGEIGLIFNFTYSV